MPTRTLVCWMLLTSAVDSVFLIEGAEAMGPPFRFDLMSKPKTIALKRSFLLNIRGGEEAQQPPPTDQVEELSQVQRDELKWSWEVREQREIPIRMILGLAAFAVKATPPDVFKRRPRPKRRVLPAKKKQKPPSPPPPQEPEVSFFAIRSLPKLEESGKQKSKPKPALPPPPPVLQQTTTALVPTPKPAKPGTATIPDLTFNLVKAIVGVGVLSLPAGIVAFGSAPSAVIPAVILVAVMGAISGVGFSWIAQVCAITGAQSYREAWSFSVSPGTSWIPALCALGKTGLACLSYSMVLADSLKSFVPIPALAQSRTALLWSVTAVVLLPLCWKKDLKSLVPFSILGVFGMVFTVASMTYRFVHGSYKTGSPLLHTVPEHLEPAFGKEGWQGVFRNPGAIVFVSMLSTAYMCHFNAPKFHRELKDNTIPRFNRLVAFGFGAAILLSAAVAAVGFATFGEACDGFVLNNYAPNDFWIHLSRLAVSASLICSYPISFQGLRDGCLDMMGIAVPDRTNAMLNQATIIILLVVTILATILKDVSFVVAFGGATLGNLLVYIYPSFMMGRVNPKARIPATILGVTGIVLGLIGSYLSLKAMG